LWFWRAGIPNECLTNMREFTRPSRLSQGRNVSTGFFSQIAIWLSFLANAMPIQEP